MYDRGVVGSVYAACQCTVPYWKYREIRLESQDDEGGSSIPAGDGRSNVNNRVSSIINGERMSKWKVIKHYLVLKNFVDI